MNDSSPGQAADDTFYKTLLESTKAIPWKIDWQTMQFTYIGPQIEDLLGWPQDSWATVQDWAERIHPDERAGTVDFCVAQSQAGTDHEADYRALRKDGGYVWIRDVVHVVRKGDEVEALVGFMFDISERKQTELELLRLQRELQELSFTDSLTGVSNRRMFDSVLEMEWTKALRSRQPLSLIMLDIDHFKSYNDRYGHLHGDQCLQQVAGLLGQAATRAGDFLARFGGEEFALILPETDEQAAALVAERCLRILHQGDISHGGRGAGPLLTASFGVGTVVPEHGTAPEPFIDAVDRRLYQAKQSGRAQVVDGPRIKAEAPRPSKRALRHST